MSQRTSVLAVFCFLSGLFATACVTTAWFLCYLGGLAELASIGSHGQKNVLLAARILAGVTVAPAVIALAFWLAARSAVREAQGALLGRGLYRTGVILAALSVLFALGGEFSVNARIDQALADRNLTPEDVLARHQSAKAKRALDDWTASLVNTLEKQSLDSTRLATLDTLGDRRLTPEQTLAIIETFDMDSDRMLAVRKCIPENVAHRFTSKQVAALCGQFMRDSTKLLVIDLCAPGLVDLDNAHRILDELDSDSSKTSANLTIRDKGGVNVGPEEKPAPPKPKEEE